MKTFSEIIEKIKNIEDVSRDKEIATTLGVSKNVFSNWKRRNTIPYKILQEYCRSKNISLDSLLGDGKIALMVKDPDVIYNKERVCVREIMKILHDNPELDEHIYHYLNSLITKPK